MLTRVDLCWYSCIRIELIQSWLQSLDQTNKFVFDPDLKSLSKLKKAYSNNPIIGYLIMNSLKEKIICLKDIISTS